MPWHQTRSKRDGKEEAVGPAAVPWPFSHCVDSNEYGGWEIGVLTGLALDSVSLVCRFFLANLVCSGLGLCEGLAVVDCSSFDLRELLGECVLPPSRCVGEQIDVG